MLVSVGAAAGTFTPVAKISMLLLLFGYLYSCSFHGALVDALEQSKGCKADACQDHASENQRDVVYFKLKRAHWAYMTTT
jgi:hypothetical protein